MHLDTVNHNKYPNISCIINTIYITAEATTPMTENKKPSLLQEVQIFTILLLFFMGLYPTIVLCYYSSLMLYQKIYVWFRYDITVDVSFSFCLTATSTYCDKIISSFPFNLISNNFKEWLIHPTDWIGLHGVISSLLGFPTWLLGYICAFIWFWIWLGCVCLVLKIVMFCVKWLKG